ncbi:MAG TPA: hypothetical protein VHH36_04170 [Candidatus Thermoplasmatota archaeon]|nr:hypothetical protein [Candidatus Thermoplasmatota archaeon]
MTEAPPSETVRRKVGSGRLVQMSSTVLLDLGLLISEKLIGLPVADYKIHFAAPAESLIVSEPVHRGLRLSSAARAPSLAHGGWRLRRRASGGGLLKRRGEGSWKAWAARELAAAEWEKASAGLTGGWLKEYQRVFAWGAGLSRAYRALARDDRSLLGSAEDLMMEFADGDAGAVSRLRELVRAARLGKVSGVHAPSPEEGPGAAVRAGIGAAKVRASAAAA